MTSARPLPKAGSIFLDARGGDRALRVSWHSEAGLVVLSLWRENVCAGSFRLSVDEVPDLIDMLRAGLDSTDPWRFVSTRPAWRTLPTADESVWSRAAPP